MPVSALAFCILHTSVSLASGYLTPFAVYQAFPDSDYYGVSVALGVAPCRRSRVSCLADVQDDLDALFVSLEPI